MSKGRALLPSRQALTRRLATAAGETAGLEAKWLVEAAGNDAQRLEAMVLRRLAGEPLDRILGHRGFWTLDLAVTPAVLSPRPDTETIVRAALDHAPASRTILDLGTGSGAILLALLAASPQATGLGVDISPEALAVARDNAVRSGLGERADFQHGSWDVALGQTFDLVVSNPPYIPTGDIAGLDREVREHDPLLGLDGGPDGLDAYRAILPLLPALLAPDGLAVLEIGYGQGSDVTALAATADLSLIEIRPDYGGVPRAAVFRRG